MTWEPYLRRPDPSASAEFPYKPTPQGQCRPRVGSSKRRTLESDKTSSTRSLATTRCSAPASSSSRDAPEIAAKSALAKTHVRPPSSGLGTPRLDRAAAAFVVPRQAEATACTSGRRYPWLREHARAHIAAHGSSSPLALQMAARRNSPAVPVSHFGSRNDGTRKAFRDSRRSKTAICKEKDRHLQKESHHVLVTQIE